MTAHKHANLMMQYAQDAAEAHAKVLTAICKGDV